MLKNGLDDRNRERKIGLWVTYISGFIFFSMFLAPLTLENGSVPKLSGRANALDYMSVDGSFSWGNQQTTDLGGIGHNQEEYGYFSWSELNPYAAMIYAFGDLNCHQKSERSWEINGNQMPVCTRDLGIFLGIFIIGLIWTRFGHNRWTIKDSMFSIFPDKRLDSIYEKNQRNFLFWGIGGLSILPILLDGGIQAISDYESDTLRRIITGALFGMGFMWFFCASLSAKPSKFDSESRVLLPANARFVQPPEEFHQDTSEE